MEPLLAALQETQINVITGILILLFLWESVHPYYAYFTDSFKSRGKHALRNLTIGALNGLLISVVFVGLWMAASVWAEEMRFGTMHWLQDATGLPVWAHAAGAFLLLDFWTYAWHRLNHEIPFFWHFHSIHHYCGGNQWKRAAKKIQWRRTVFS